jgi:hypothetical protein
MGFSPGFFAAGAKAHDQGRSLFRNAEALLPSAEAEGSHQDSKARTLRNSVIFGLRVGFHRRELKLQTLILGQNSDGYPGQ